jgi:hypothetical protein
MKIVSSASEEGTCPGCVLVARLVQTQLPEPLRGEWNLMDKEEQSR